MRTLTQLLLTATSLLIAACHCSPEEAAPPDPWEVELEDTQGEGLSGDTQEDSPGDTQGDDSPADTQDTPPVDTDAGDSAPSWEETSLGELSVRYGFLVLEADYSGADDTTLNDSSCDAITTVPEQFVLDLCQRYGGKLDSGQVVQPGEGCDCGFECFSGLPPICFEALDAEAFPWGWSREKLAVDPLRSWAVDSAIAPLGALLYVPSWDGVSIPVVGDLGGFVHDGCFRVDDCGCTSVGTTAELFAGSSHMAASLASMVTPGTSTEVFLSEERCAHLALEAR
jgi:3D (Asp-Asp-Asp) domain-containing protein